MLHFFAEITVLLWVSNVVAKGHQYYLIKLDMGLRMIYAFLMMTKGRRRMLISQRRKTVLRTAFPKDDEKAETP